MDETLPGGDGRVCGAGAWVGYAVSVSLRAASEVSSAD
jgi:hypothetical protein